MTPHPTRIPRPDDFGDATFRGRDAAGRNAGPLPPPHAGEGRGGGRLVAHDARGYIVRPRPGREGRPARRGASKRLLPILLALALLPLTACEKEKQFEPPDRAAQVAQADSLYSAALFDTIAWESDEARVAEGNRVFAEECRRCHGPLGRGGTDYARSQDLDVPSLVEPEWEYTGDHDAVRHRVFIGHEAGMPTWGVAGITPREIDAAAAYVLEQLRPDVLGAEDAPEADRRDTSTAVEGAGRR